MEIRPILSSLYISINCFEHNDSTSPPTSSKQTHIPFQHVLSSSFHSLSKLLPRYLLSRNHLRFSRLSNDFLASATYTATTKGRIYPLSRRARACITMAETLNWGIRFRETCIRRRKIDKGLYCARLFELRGEE